MRLEIDERSNQTALVVTPKSSNVRSRPAFAVLLKESSPKTKADGSCVIAKTSRVPPVALQMLMSLKVPSSKQNQDVKRCIKLLLESSYWRIPRPKWGERAVPFRHRKQAPFKQESMFACGSLEVEHTLVCTQKKRWGECRFGGDTHFH